MRILRRLPASYGREAVPRASRRRPARRPL